MKRLREKITTGQREFETEVNILGKIRHPNLLAMRAYYLGPKGESFSLDLLPLSFHSLIASNLFSPDMSLQYSNWRVAWEWNSRSFQKNLTYPSSVGRSAGYRSISTLVMKFRVFMCMFLNDRGVMCLFLQPYGGLVYFTIIYTTTTSSIYIFKSIWSNHYTTVW